MLKVMFKAIFDKFSLIWQTYVHPVKINEITYVAPVTVPHPTVHVAPVTASYSTIAISNFSTILSDTEVQQAIAAAQIQIDRDFAPIWNMPANLVFVPKSQKPSPTAWVMQIFDTSDQAGALGYHKMTNTGLPLGKIFAKDDQKFGLSWTVTLTHEILEMLGDPYLTNCVFVQDTNTSGNLYAFELCDSCEADSLAYKINGILVSDFVLPAFFEAGRAPNSTKFDFMGVLTAPLQVAAGGYMSVFAVNPTTTGWTQLTGAEGAGIRLIAKGGSSRPQRRANSVPKIIIAPAKKARTIPKPVVKVELPVVTIKAKVSKPRKAKPKA